MKFIIIKKLSSMIEVALFHYFCWFVRGELTKSVIWYNRIDLFPIAAGTRYLIWRTVWFRRDCSLH